MEHSGCHLGASLGGIVFLPWLFVRGTIILAICSIFAAAWIAYIQSEKQRVQAGVIGGIAAIMIGCVLFVFAAPWAPLKMTAGTYKYVYNMDDRSREGVYNSHVKPYELMYYAEGLSSVVIVARNKKRGCMAGQQRQNRCLQQSRHAHASIGLPPSLFVQTGSGRS